MEPVDSGIKIDSNTSTPSGLGMSGDMGTRINSLLNMLDPEHVNSYSNTTFNTVSSGINEAANSSTLSIQEYAKLDDINLKLAEKGIDVTTNFNRNENYFHDAVNELAKSTDVDKKDVEALTLWYGNNKDNKTITISETDSETLRTLQDKCGMIESDSGASSFEDIEPISLGDTQSEAREDFENYQATDEETTDDEADAESSSNSHKDHLDNEEYDAVYQQIKDCYNTYADTSGVILSKIKAEFNSCHENLNKYTKGTLSYDVLGNINSVLGSLWPEHDDILSFIETEASKAQDIDSTTLDSTDDGGGSSGSGSTGGSKGSKSGGSGTVSRKPRPEPNPIPDSGFLETMSAGTLVFTSLVPLYDQIGGTSTIQSSLTGTYDVVGIVNQDGEYFYKIYDKSLSKYYFAGISSAAMFTTGYSQLLVSKEGEGTMMLTSPETDTINFSKMTDPNTAYFVKDKVGDDKQFAVVLDGSDGKTYYVPVDDSVELVDLNTVIPNESLVNASPVVDTATPQDTPTESIEG